MKSLLLIMGIFTSGFMIFTTETESNFKKNSSYKWRQAAPPGSGRWPEKWENGKWPMGIVPILAFENKLWMVGQKNSWYSEDGLEWRANSKPDWGVRHGMSCTFFKNKIWMSGGMTVWDDFRNDIWYTSDGIQWAKAIEKAPWQERIRHKTIVFNNELWLIGGTLTSGKSDQLPTQFLNDIWSSEDGIHWTLEISKAPWPARHDAKVFVFKEKMWVLGGGDEVGGPGKTDIWNSADGKEWTLVTDQVPWSGRTGNGVLVFDNLIWVFGGINLSDGGMNDVWCSSDGIHWTQINAAAPWSKRSTESSVVFKNKLWIYSGKTGRDDSWSGDIWTLLRD